MRAPIRFRCIKDGKTYNTETSIHLASSTNEDDPFEEQLFKTRLGTYFLYWEHPNSGQPGITPLDDEAARTWLERMNLVDQYEAEFGLPPEAGEDTEARLTLRIPESLRKKVQRLALDRKQSLNTVIQQALENLVRGDRQ